MRSREEVVRKLIGQWAAKAESDFAAAEALLAHESLGLDAIAFHSQQCAEKYLKAFLTRHQIEFPKTHKIGELLDLAARVDAELAELLRDAGELTPYGVEIRYPGNFPDVTRPLAEEAFDLASKARKAVREALGEFLSGEAREGTSKP